METRFDIDAVAALARLRLTPEQRERFGAEMERIAALAEDLPEPMESDAALRACAPLREDIAEACGIAQEDYFRNAPAVSDHCFAVPQTVEEQA